MSDDRMKPKRVITSIQTTYERDRPPQNADGNPVVGFIACVFWFFIICACLSSCGR